MQGRNPAAGLGHKAAAGQSQAPPPGNAPPPPNGQSARPGLWARIPKPLRRAAFFILPSLWFWDNVACIGVVQGRSMQVGSAEWIVFLF